VRRSTPKPSVRRLSGPRGGLHLAVAAGEGRHRVWGSALLVPAAATLHLVGGDAPHVGAVALSLPGSATTSRASTSVLTVAGHREDELVRALGAELTERLGCTSVVIAGIHLERASAADIAAVRRNARRAVQAVVAAARELRPAGPRRAPAAGRGNRTG
jgi:hypothetical protein